HLPPLSLHDALPIFLHADPSSTRIRLPSLFHTTWISSPMAGVPTDAPPAAMSAVISVPSVTRTTTCVWVPKYDALRTCPGMALVDRKSTRLNSSHVS